jgi:uncharacterized protein (DUF1697 family)
MNAKMPELKKAFEAAGFTNVKTLLSSGNVVFDAAKATDESLQRKAETAMREQLGKEFLTIVRSVDKLRELLASEPYGNFNLADGSKRVVTFLRSPIGKRPELPITLDGASIVAMTATEVFSAYVKSDKGPVFMSLIEKTFGKDVTTRTWDTVMKAAK